MPKAIGIDLGTTSSCAAVFINGKVKIIPNEDEEREMPSYVAFSDHGCLIGKEAKNHAKKNPRNTVFGKFFVIYFNQKHIDCLLKT